MSFVLLLALQGLTFPDGLVDLATTAVPWALFALFPRFYNCEKAGGAFTTSSAMTKAQEAMCAHWTLVAVYICQWSL